MQLASTSWCTSASGRLLVVSEVSAEVTWPKLVLESSRFLCVFCTSTKVKPYMPQRCNLARAQWLYRAADFQSYGGKGWRKVIYMLSQRSGIQLCHTCIQRPQGAALSICPQVMHTQSICAS